MSDNLSRVQEVTAEKLGVDVAEVTTAKKFVDDLGADSLDLTELVMALEDEFDIEIEDDDSEKFGTVQNVLDYLETL